MIKKEHLVKIKEFNVVTISSYVKKKNYRRKTHTYRGEFLQQKRPLEPYLTKYNEDELTIVTIKI